MLNERWTHDMYESDENDYKPRQNVKKVLKNRKKVDIIDRLKILLVVIVVETRIIKKSQECNHNHRHQNLNWNLLKQ